jgi:predicted alpha/beta-fold hydrolase
MDDRDYLEQEFPDKKKRSKNVKKIKELEKAILQQTLAIKQAKDYYEELVSEYNKLSQQNIT